MRYQPRLQAGRLVRRYKRFLADIETPGGEVVTMHCANTGSMKNCAVEGSRVWYWLSDNPKRKYPHTWELVETLQSEMAGESIAGVACINTARANGLVREALEAGVIAPLQYERIRTEVPYGAERSRIDLLLESEGTQKCYVEVKSVTLSVGDGLGLFPDAVSARGSKHLRELMAMVAEGHRAVLFFAVLHTGIKQVAPAVEIDPVYAKTLQQAIAAGVEVMAYGASIDADAIMLTHQLGFSLEIQEPVHD